MKKLMMFMAMMALVAIFAQAGEPVFKNWTVTVPVNRTVATSEVVRVANTGVGREDWNLAYRLDAINGTTSTGTVTFVSVENGVNYTIATTGSIAGLADTEVAFPEMSVSRTVIENLVTNGVVTGATVTNTVTEYKLIPVRDVRVIVTQDATNTVAGTWSGGIFAK